MASPLPPLYPRLTLTVPRRSFPGCSPNSLFRFIQSTTAHIENLGGNYYLRLSKPSATNNNEFYEKIRHFIFLPTFCTILPFTSFFVHLHFSSYFFSYRLILGSVFDFRFSCLLYVTFPGRCCRFWSCFLLYIYACCLFPFLSFSLSLAIPVLHCTYLNHTPLLRSTLPEAQLGHLDPPTYYPTNQGLYISDICQDEFAALCYPTHAHRHCLAPVLVEREECRHRYTFSLGACFLTLNDRLQGRLPELTHCSTVSPQPPRYQRSTCYVRGYVQGHDMRMGLQMSEAEMNFMLPSIERSLGSGRDNRMDRRSLTQCRSQILNRAHKRSKGMKIFDGHYI